MSFLKQNQPLKSLWRENSSKVWSFFCPLCRVQRKVPYRSRPGGFRQYMQIGLTAAFFTLVTRKWFQWKGIVSFLPLWISFEVFYRTRMRAAVGCPQCGFDPYLYLVDIKRAHQEIESHWRKKFAEKGMPFPEKDRPASFASTEAEPTAEEKQETHAVRSQKNSGTPGKDGHGRNR